MKGILSILICLIAVLGFTQSPTYISGELYVKTVNTYSGNLTQVKDREEQLSKLLLDYNVSEVIKPFILQDENLQHTYLFKFSKSVDELKFIEAIEKFSFIEFSERVPQMEFFYTPNDLHPNQWNLVTIQAEQAWNITQGNANIKIGMVDDAVLLSHEDLQAVIWTNPNEISGNGIDDDNNGYVDDVNGWDTADNDNNPNPLSSTNSYFTHGTHCSGIAAATTDNNIGIASISSNVTLVPVKIGTDANSSLTGALAGVQYAIVAGVDVISMSWGGGGYSTTYQNMFDYAYNQGITCVAAAGNSSTSIPMYPAAYNHVISVGSTRNGDVVSSFSNYGSTIDVMAPGSSIWSTLAGSILLMGI
ncbi:MAG: S8 family serine peptidase [Flavobacteriales bacterium]|nr:S8 family serine peptidase [Flavobacteriales bacterium]